MLIPVAAMTLTFHQPLYLVPFAPLLAIGAAAGVAIVATTMPEWARRMTGTYQPDPVYRLLFAPSDRLKASVVRWAYPELPCKAMALQRAAARAEVATAAA